MSIGASSGSFSFRSYQKQLLLLLVYACGLAAALPSWRYLLPNGDRVSCPDGAQGCVKGAPELDQPENACFGLGHATCGGGSMPLNPFGVAFAASGFKWTTDLCAADSDGDGQTNGQELGDPCCEWKVNDRSSIYMASFNPTHPGMADHNQGANYTVPECGPEMVPTHRGGTTAAFQPGEEQRILDWRIKNFTIPTERTVYQDFFFNFDDTTHEIFHIAWGEAIISLPKNLHHFVVSGCSAKVPDEFVGVPVSRAEMSQFPTCNAGFGGWAPGAKMWDNPVSAGTPIGAGAGIVAIQVQVHFTDGDIYPGTSTDGIRLFYTPSLRSKVVESTSIINIGQHPQIIVPPGKKRFFVTRKCAVEAPSPLQIVATNFHAHLLGTEMYQTVVRHLNGKRENFNSQPIWHFDDQRNLFFEQGSRFLYPGDLLEATCVYNSIGRSTPTQMSVETYDEMCFNQIMTLHDTSSNGLSAEGPAFTCDDGGNLWTGEMADTESGFELQKVHPESKAEDVWEMSSIRPGVPGIRTSGDNGAKACENDEEAFKIAVDRAGLPLNSCAEVPLPVCSRMKLLETVCCARCSGNTKTPGNDALTTAKSTTFAPSAKKIEIDWTSFFNPAISKNVEASPGDTVVFSWSGNHNVFEFSSRAAYETCDFKAATLVGSVSSIQIMSDADLPDGTQRFFGCAVGSHCVSGQKCTVAYSHVKDAAQDEDDFPAGSVAGAAVGGIVLIVVAALVIRSRRSAARKPLTPMVQTTDVLTSSITCA